MSFVNIHTHTEYSLLDGIIKVKDLFKRVKELGMTAVACTEHGNMSGTIKKYKLAKAEGIKLLIGIELYVVNDMLVKEKGDKRYHLLVIAKNLQGYKNLIKIASAAACDGFYHRPRVDKKLLEKYSGGLICTSACMQNDAAQAILKDDIDKAREIIKGYIDMFGQENFFLEVANHNISGEEIIAENYFKLAKELGVRVIFGGDAHFLKKENARAHEVVLCLNNKDVLSNPNRFRFSGTNHHFLSEEEARALYPEHPEIFDNTQVLADMCDVQLDLGKPIFPDFPVPEGETQSSFLKKMCYGGFEKKYGSWPEDDKKKAQERLEYEFGVIEKMGFVEYFLITWDVLSKVGKMEGIDTAGRGSAAGSLVSYCLGIHQLEPIKNELLFERFLNPDRVSLPDIDNDFADRNVAITYVKEKYGSDKVAVIGTFGTLACKLAVKDTARAFGVPYDEVNEITKQFPDDDMDTAVQIPAVVEFFKKYPGVEQESRVIQDVIKFNGVHACLAGDSEIYTDIGYRSIKDCCGNKVKVLTKNGYKDAIVIEAGEKKVFSLSYCKSKYVNDKGYIKLTNDHRVFNNGLFKQAKDIVGEDIEHCNVILDKIDVLAGWFWLDGYYDRSVGSKDGGHICFTPKNDDEALEYFKEFLSGQKQKCYQYRLKNEVVTEIIRRFGDGFVGKRNADKLSPIFKDNFSKMGWLKGMLSANATVQVGEIRYKVASRRIIQCVKQAMLDIGFSSSNILRRQAKRDSKIKDRLVKWRDPYEIYYSRSVSSKYGYMIGLLQTYKNDSFIKNQFLSLEYIGKEMTYDFSVLSVDENDHNAYVDGILVHNSGVVWGKEAIIEYVPVRLDAEGNIVTQYDMNELEAVGLVKMDFLGVDTMNIERNILKMIGKDDRWLKSIPMDDKAVYEMLSLGDSCGVFQLESGGMVDTLKKIRPTCFEDLVAIVALYRPGSMDYVDVYARRKNGEEEIVYDHPKLEPILKNTMAVICYQEQTMIMSRVLAGFTGGEADTLRKAIGKKILALMQSLETKFKEGCIKNSGMTERQVTDLWNKILKSADYSFNKSHAASYALTSYRTAYFRKHYPMEFMTAMINSTIGNIEKQVFYINEAKRMGLDILPADINLSAADFNTDGKTGIRFGLGGIKNVSGVSLEIIMANRPYKSFIDFVNKVDISKVNRRVQKHLIMAGCFDNLGVHRNMLLAGYLDIIPKEKNNKEVQMTLFGTAAIEYNYPKRHEPTLKEKMDYEKESMGITASGDMMELYPGYSDNWIPDNLDYGVFIAFGIVKTVKKVFTKKDNREMAFMTVENNGKRLEMVVFPKTYAVYAGAVEEDLGLMIKGLKKENSYIVETLEIIKPVEVGL